MANKTSNIPAASKSKADSSSLLEKYLAFGFLGSVIVSVITIFIIILAPLTSGTFVPSGMGVIPILVMPFGFACLIALLVIGAYSRKKSSRKN